MLECSGKIARSPSLAFMRFHVFDPRRLIARDRVAVAVLPGMSRRSCRAIFFVRMARGQPGRRQSRLHCL